MKKLKIATMVIMALLLILTIVSLLLGGFMPLFSIAFGLLFAYYILVYGLIYLTNKTGKMIFTYLGIGMFFLPIIWAVWDFENLLDFLLQGIHLDMK
ncbi:hypothetical protein ACOKFD_12515 [Flagellimonas sp. S174]|uniref:hypothetical protein n=1 Tax=Flagellimonas sp. S174 TaxID=3410790 RepID=UPI003BF53527